MGMAKHLEPRGSPRRSAPPKGFLARRQRNRLLSSDRLLAAEAPIRPLRVLSAKAVSLKEREGAKALKKRGRSPAAEELQIARSTKARNQKKIGKKKVGETEGAPA